MEIRDKTGYKLPLNRARQFSSNLHMVRIPNHICALLDGRADMMATPLNLRRALAVLVALGFQCFLVNAQEQHVISGIGAQRCAALTAKRTAGTNTNDTLTAALTWIEGFISGLNMNAENEFYY